MAYESLRQLLDPRVLIPHYNQRQGVRELLLTDAFFRNAQDVQADDFEMIYYPAMNEPSPGNTRGAEARILVPQGATRRTGTLFNNFNRIPLGMNAFHALREPDSFAIQQKGITTVTRIVDEFAERQRLFKEVVIASILQFHRVNLDAQGRVLRPTVNATSGAITDHADTVYSCDFEVPDSHRGNLDGMIAAQWSANDTKIFTHLDEIDDAAEALNVPKPTEIWLHSINKQHLRNNTEFQTWAKESNMAPDTLLRGEMIEGLWGKNWHFYGNKYQAPGDSGNSTDIINNTLAIMTPPLGPWLQASRGSEFVPRSVGVQSDFSAALAEMDVVFGEFAYAFTDHNPPRVDLFMGDNFGLNFADPNAIWVGKVFTQS